jgi:hypothetical protein
MSAVFRQLLQRACSLGDLFQPWRVTLRSSSRSQAASWIPVSCTLQGTGEKARNKQEYK